MIREVPVQHLLYEDAKRRAQSAGKSRPVPKLPRYTLNKSDEYIAKKLIRDFEELSNLYFPQQKEHRFTYA